ncbi:MAG: hypothetical protein EBY39_01555 [Flavobacteriia bacterium]|nr:hypothetical protein [Flavobacteriia bacterium]
MKKFIQMPLVLQDDVIDGKLIGNDLLIYCYLLTKASHGEPIFFSNKKIGDDLGGMSHGKVSASLSRLSSAGHIRRFRTCNKTGTQLKTIVRNKGNITIRGKTLDKT